MGKTTHTFLRTQRELDEENSGRLHPIPKRVGIFTQLKIAHPNELLRPMKAQGIKGPVLIRLCQAFTSCLLIPLGNLLIIGSLL